MHRTNADNFSLTYGLRFDIPLLFNDPTVNNEFNEYAASKNIKERVGEMPGAKVMVSPRLGFRWYTDDSRTTLIRGGLGLFIIPGLSRKVRLSLLPVRLPPLRWDNMRMIRSEP